MPWAAGCRFGKVEEVRSCFEEWALFLGAWDGFVCLWYAICNQQADKSVTVITGLVNIVLLPLLSRS